MKDVIKRNLVSIACGVVALLAIGFVFYPLGGMFAEIQDSLADSARVYADMQSLTRKSHSLPLVDPDKTDPENLAQFPTEKIIKAGLDVVADLEKQSKEILDQVAAMNVKQPLLKSALGKSPQGIALANFQISYYQALQRLKQKMNAATPPTDEEMKQISAELWKTEFEPKVAKVAGNDNRVELQTQFQTRTERLPEEIKQERAKKATLYWTSDKAIGPHEGIPAIGTSETRPDPIEVWAAQLGLWIQEDIANAIIETNAKGGSTVATSIVKRLVNVEIPKRYITKDGGVDIGQMGRQYNRMAWAKLKPTESEQPDPSGPSFQPRESPTGRVSNVLYDVVHFTITVDCDARRFQEFMSSLIRNRFITILKVDLAGVDRDVEQLRGYLYGPDPVIRVSLNCEAVFFRSWTRQWMPEEIQKALRMPPEEPAATAGLQ